MKIELDTKEKTIKVAEDVNLEEFISLAKQLLPDGLWKEYTLKTNTIINWTSTPIVINLYRPYYPQPYYPWITYTNDVGYNYSNLITTGIGTAIKAKETISGTYQIDIK